MGRVGTCPESDTAGSFLISLRPHPWAALSGAEIHLPVMVSNDELAGAEPSKTARVRASRLLLGVSRWLAHHPAISDPGCLLDSVISLNFRQRMHSRWVDRRFSGLSSFTVR